LSALHLVLFAMLSALHLVLFATFSAIHLVLFATFSAIHLVLFASLNAFSTYTGCRIECYNDKLHHMVYFNSSNLYL